jgi:hypothetical protein
MNAMPCQIYNIAERERFETDQTNLVPRVLVGIFFLDRPVEGLKW